MFRNPKLNRAEAIISITIIVVIIIFGIIITTQNSTGTSTADTSQCQQNADGECTIFPEITTENLDGEEITFPGDLSAPLNIFVMPFDREQQTRAGEWLAPLRSLADSHDIAYYSLAALPDLDTAVRVLVVGGVNLAVRDPEARQLTMIAFLDNQDEFAQALQINDLEQMQVLLVDNRGEVLWRVAGDYSDESFESLTEQIEMLSTVD